MLNLPATHRETDSPEFSIEQKLLVGIPAFCALLLVLLAVGWVISGGSAAFMPGHFMHRWWLEFTGLIQRVFAVVVVAAVVVGCSFSTLALGGVILALWRRLRWQH